MSFVLAAKPAYQATHTGKGPDGGYTGGTSSQHPCTNQHADRTRHHGDVVLCDGVAQLYPVQQASPLHSTTKAHNVSGISPISTNGPVKIPRAVHSRFYPPAMVHSSLTSGRLYFVGSVLDLSSSIPWVWFLISSMCLYQKNHTTYFATILSHRSTPMTPFSCGISNHERDDTAEHAQ